MTRINTQIRINVSKEQVWKVIADFGGVVNFNPNISNSYSTSKENGGVGATRHCDLLPMGTVEERISDWKEGDEYSIEITDGKRIAPFKFAKGQISLKRDGDQTLANINFDYQLKYGVIGALMNALIIKSRFNKAIHSLTDGLKYYAETGQRATREALSQAHAAA